MVRCDRVRVPGLAFVERISLVTLAGGWDVGSDGLIHGIYTHNPSSLRLSMHSPNLQQIPRGGGSEVQAWVKECFVAPEGWIFWERDFSGIEAILVGYFAGCARYVRLAKLGVHAYLASHILARPLDLGMSDGDLRLAIKEVKALAGPIGIYDTAKRIIHGSNYMMTASKMNYEYPETFRTVKDAAKLQDLYFELFPEIRTWHKELCDRVDGTKRRTKDLEMDGGVDPWTLGVCHVVNPFGYLHRFYNVLDWERVNYEGSWHWISSFGEDAKRLISFLPQSTASAIIKRAAKALYYDYPWVGETLRLLIHDSVFGMCKKGYEGECLRISQSVMEAPIKALPLDPSWGMGEFLTIGSEAKTGTSWGAMH